METGRKQAAVLRPFDKLRAQDDGHPLDDQVLIFRSFMDSKFTMPPPTRLVV